MNKYFLSPVAVYILFVLNQNILQYKPIQSFQSFQSIQSYQSFQSIKSIKSIQSIQSIQSSNQTILQLK